MKDILTGIRNTFVSDATLSGAVTGMYFEQAPGGVNMPYITYHLIGNAPTWDFGPVTYEQPVIQFSIFSDKQNSASEVCQIYSDLVLLYDDATIAMDDHTHVMFQRGFSRLSKLGDEAVWLYSVDYESMFVQD